MNDIDLAKKLLEEGFNLAIVKNGKAIYTSNERGIKPIYTAVCQMKEELKDSSIADKVIGKAAAILCKDTNIKEIYTKFTSKGAIEVLKQENIKFTYEKSCDYIVNRDKTDMCPMEKLACTTEDKNILLQKIKEFLSNI